MVTRGECTSMILRSIQKTARLLMVAAFSLFAITVSAAAPTGPTLEFDYGHGEPHSNSVDKFMYFVPLISPESVSVFTNAGNTQCVRVLLSVCRTNAQTFSATCEFEFSGAGSQQNVFDHTNAIRKHLKELSAGGTLKRQLASINVTGTGSGSIEIAGMFTNGQPVVNMLELRFNRRGSASPVTINLQDIVFQDGVARAKNEMVARVNALTFHRTTGTPKMEVSLASLKRKDAGNGLWQNFVGSLKGATVNLFLPPLTVEREGQQAMLDFGLALAMKKPAFTFPPASRLKSIAQSAP
ncbi:MAG: hypothetical protein WDM80_05520 [Limisphaerales bacterium]